MELSTCQHRYTLSSSSSSGWANGNTSSGNLARNQLCNKMNICVAEPVTPPLPKLIHSSTTHKIQLIERGNAINNTQVSLQPNKDELYRSAVDGHFQARHPPEPCIATLFGFQQALETSKTNKHQMFQKVTNKPF